MPGDPYTPEEYAAEARRIVDEGGVHIHVHARRPDGTPSFEVEDFRAISDAIRAEVVYTAIVNFSTGAVGVPVAKRVAYLRAVPPRGRRAEHGSMNYAKYSARRKDFLPPRSHWGVIGISRAQWMPVAAALTLGGSVRVGLEDNLHLPDGTMARSNGELVAKARQLPEDVGRRPATVQEARRMLGVPARAEATA